MTSFPYNVMNVNNGIQVEQMISQYKSSGPLVRSRLIRPSPSNFFHFVRKSSSLNNISHDAKRSSLKQKRLNDQRLTNATPHSDALNKRLSDKKQLVLSRTASCSVINGFSENHSQDLHHKNDRLAPLYGDNSYSVHAGSRQKQYYPATTVPSTILFYRYGHMKYENGDDYREIIANIDPDSVSYSSPYSFCQVHLNELLEAVKSVDRPHFLITLVSYDMLTRLLQDISHGFPLRDLLNQIGISIFSGQRDISYRSQYIPFFKQYQELQSTCIHIGSEYRTTKAKYRSWIKRDKTIGSRWRSQTQKVIKSWQKCIYQLIFHEIRAYGQANSTRRGKVSKYVTGNREGKAVQQISTIMLSWRLYTIRVKCEKNVDLLNKALTIAAAAHDEFMSLELNLPSRDQQRKLCSLRLNDAEQALDQAKIDHIRYERDLQLVTEHRANQESIIHAILDSIEIKPNQYGDIPDRLLKDPVVSGNDDVAISLKDRFSRLIEQRSIAIKTPTIASDDQVVELCPRVLEFFLQPDPVSLQSALLWLSLLESTTPISASDEYWPAIVPDLRKRIQILTTRQQQQTAVGKITPVGGDGLRLERSVYAKIMQDLDKTKPVSSNAVLESDIIDNFVQTIRVDSGESDLSLLKVLTRWLPILAKTYHENIAESGRIGIKKFWMMTVTYHIIDSHHLSPIIVEQILPGGSEKSQDEVDFEGFLATIIRASRLYHCGNTKLSQRLDKFCQAHFNTNKKTRVSELDHRGARVQFHIQCLDASFRSILRKHVVLLLSIFLAFSGTREPGLGKITITMGFNGLQAIVATLESTSEGKTAASFSAVRAGLFQIFTGSQVPPKQSDSISFYEFCIAQAAISSIMNPSLATTVASKLDDFVTNQLALSSYIRKQTSRPYVEHRLQIMLNELRCPL